MYDRIRARRKLEVLLLAASLPSKGMVQYFPHKSTPCKIIPPLHLPHMCGLALLRSSAIHQTQDVCVWGFDQIWSLNACLQSFTETEWSKKLWISMNWVDMWVMETNSLKLSAFSIPAAAGASRCCRKSWASARHHSSSILATARWALLLVPPPPSPPNCRSLPYSSREACIVFTSDRAGC